MVMEDAPAVEFSLQREGEDELPQQFILKLGASLPVRIGRAPGNDIAVLNNRAISQYHCELWFKTLDGSSIPQLCARDKSMNGTGLQAPGALDPTTLDKDVDTLVPDGSTLVIPLLLKENQTESDRKRFKVVISRAPEASHSKEVREESSEEKDNEPNGKDADDNEEAENDEEDGNNDGGDQAAREQFANLLQEEPKVSSETTYEEAREMLGSQPAWKAVSDEVRRECFDTFVSFLKDMEAKSKKKHKKKKSKKDKKDKDDGDDNSDKDDSPSKKKKRGRDDDGKEHRKSRRHSRNRSSGSNDRHRSKDKRGRR